MRSEGGRGDRERAAGGGGTRRRSVGGIRIQDQERGGGRPHKDRDGKRIHVAGSRRE